MREPFLSFIRREIRADSVLITCGLPATNKTETAEVIAREKGLVILRADLIRREILRGEDVFDEKIASDMGRRELVYERMFLEADALAASGKGVILDATFVTQSLRGRAADVAAHNRRAFVIEETTAPEPYSLAKISRRTKENYESNALTETAYQSNRNRFEPVDLDDLKRLYPGLSIMHFTVDTASDSGEGWYVTGTSFR
jgi:predicted kinase